MTLRLHRPKSAGHAPQSDRESFLRRFLGDPKRTGAVAPSSPFLAREMARAIDPLVPGLVIELGPGTGPVTKALIAHGVRRERLLLVEYDAYFCHLLAERYPRARVLRGDAYALGQTLAGQAARPVAAVVSSLPLLNETPERRMALLDDAFELMGPEGVFVQFTYGLRSPMPREALAARYVGRSGAPILRNLPPASVWTYRLRGSAGQPKVMKFRDHAERLGARFNEGCRATETLIGRHSDRVKEMLKREAAAFGRRGDRP